MPRSTRPFIRMLVAAAGFVAPLPAAAQVVMGVVRDLRTARPLPDARVALVADSAAPPVAVIQTDSVGRFGFGLPAAARVHLVATAIGYVSERSAPFVVTPRDTIRIVFDLGRDTTVAEPARPANDEPPSLIAIADSIQEASDATDAGIALTVDGFEIRRTQRRGIFLDQEAIARHGATTAVDLLQGTRVSIQIDYQSVPARVMTTVGGVCAASLVLNGYPLDPRNAPVALLSSVPASALHGVEIHARVLGGVPPDLLFASQFRGARPPCAVIAFWFRG